MSGRCDSVVSLFFVFFFLLSKDTAELFFEDVRLPAGALLGGLNKGFYYLMNELPQVKRTWGNMACWWENDKGSNLVFRYFVLLCISLVNLMVNRRIIFWCRSVC